MVDRRLEVLEEMCTRSKDENYEHVEWKSTCCAFRIPVRGQALLSQEVSIRIPVHNFVVSEDLLDWNPLHYIALIQTTNNNFVSKDILT